MVKEQALSLGILLSHSVCNVQSSVQTFMSGFGHGRHIYCAIVHFWGGQRNILRVILGT